MMTPAKEIRIEVPGSTSNLGPGFDVLGLALDRTLRARWVPGDEPLRLTTSGLLEGLDPAHDLVHRSAAAALGVDPHDLTGALHLTSAIPTARGLGSSAAARVAGRVLALALRDSHRNEAAQAVGGPWPVSSAEQQALVREVTVGEGHPDNAVPSVVGGFVASSSGAEGVRWTHLPLSPSVGLVFAAPGVEVRTNEAREALPATVAHRDAVENVGRLAVLLAGLARADGDRIAWGLHDRLHTPWRWPLVPRADEAREAALAQGAWGVTLSGSGSGLIAFAPRAACTAVAGAMGEVFSGVAGGAGHHAFEARPMPVGATTLAVPSE